MPLQVAVAAFDSSRRRWRWVFLLVAAAGVSGYGAYKVYRLPSVVRRRRELMRLAGALGSLAEAASSSTEALGLVSADLNRFLRSDTGDIPTSFRQIAKIARSSEFSGSISKASEVVTTGIIRGFGSAAASIGQAESWESTSRISYSTFLDRFLDKLFSATGSGFAAAVVGSFASNLVSALHSIESCEKSDEGAQGWTGRLICDDKSKELVADCVRLFASAAVTAYLDRMRKTSSCDEIFSSLTNPKHEAKVKDILVAVCSGAVETLVKTSHRVMFDSTRQDESARQKATRKATEEEKEAEEGDGWVGGVSSALAIPISNGRLLLDVTGRVAVEAMRSLLDFLQWRLRDAARRGVSVMHEEVLERGIEVVKYVGAKSIVRLAVCLALCLQLSIGTKLLMPA